MQATSKQDGESPASERAGLLEALSEAVESGAALAR